MELINSTRMVCGYTMGLEPSGRELLVVVIKGTFQIPSPGEEVRLHDEQLPLVMADTFTGAPGISAPVREIDFAPRKKACDVLLTGSAYAPIGRPADRIPVGLRVGDWSKSFAVVGHRHWYSSVSGFSATEPETFLSLPLGYDVAFGGTDQRHENPSKHGAFMRNPVGRGWHHQLKHEWVEGALLPNTEEATVSITHPNHEYKPMAFGPIGRGWEPRSRFAGTYDEQWLERHFPFLPTDFDERYYQAAPEDQQITIPVDGQDVSLLNLTPDGLRRFRLPHFEAPVHIFPKKGEREDYTASLDTIVFEPDQERFTLTWRVCRPLKRNMFEIAQILIGRKGREWWQQREEGGFPIPVVMVPIRREPEEAEL